MNVVELSDYKFNKRENNILAGPFFVEAYHILAAIGSATVSSERLCDTWVASCLLPVCAVQVAT